jgi:hypothetical protein
MFSLSAALLRLEIRVRRQVVLLSVDYTIGTSLLVPLQLFFRRPPVS